jgi:hypothetical protein
MPQSALKETQSQKRRVRRSGTLWAMPWGTPSEML